MPQKGSVHGVVSFGKVERQLQGCCIFPRQFFQSSCYDEHHVNRRALEPEPTLLFRRQNILTFAVVTHATRDDFEECFAVS